MSRLPLVLRLPVLQDEDISERTTKAARTVVAIVLDFLIWGVALVTFRGVELIIGYCWRPNPLTGPGAADEARPFVAAHGIPIAIPHGTDGPFILGFLPLIVALGLYTIFDVISGTILPRPASMRDCLAGSDAVASGPGESWLSLDLDTASTPDGAL